MTLTGGVEAEVTPYGFLIYLNRKDYKTIVKDDTGGVVRSPDSDPKTIRGRLAVINLKGFSPTFKDVKETREHEVRHLLFNLFLDHTPRYSSDTAEIQLQQIRTAAEGGSFETELTGHREFAGALREYYSEKGKNEIIAYMAHTDDYLDPFEGLGSGNFISHLDNVWEHLSKRADLTNDQKQAIYGTYHRSFVHYMDQTRFFQWVAHKVYPSKGDTDPKVSAYQAEAMLQLSSPGTVRRLGAQFGIDQDAMRSTFVQEQEESVKAFSDLVENAISQYEQKRIGEMLDGWIFAVSKYKMDRFIGTAPFSLVPALQKILDKAPDNLSCTNYLMKRAIIILRNIIHMHYPDMSRETLTGIIDSLDAVSARNDPFKNEDTKKEAKVLKETIEIYMKRRPDAQGAA